MIDFHLGNRILTEKEFLSLPNNAVTALITRAALRKLPQLSENKIVLNDKTKAAELFSDIENSIHSSILASLNKTSAEFAKAASQILLKHKNEDRMIDILISTAAVASIPLYSNEGLIYANEAIDLEFNETLHFLLKADYDLLLNANDNLKINGKLIYEYPTWHCGKTDTWKIYEQKLKKLLKKLHIPKLFERYKSGGASYLKLPFDSRLFAKNQ